MFMVIALTVKAENSDPIIDQVFFCTATDTEFVYENTFPCENVYIDLPFGTQYRAGGYIKYTLTKDEIVAFLLKWDENKSTVFDIPISIVSGGTTVIKYVRLCINY